MGDEDFDAMEEVAVTIGADHMLHAFNYATLGIQYLQNHDIRVGEVAPPQSIMPQVSDGIGIPTGSDIVDALDIFG